MSNIITLSVPVNFSRSGVRRLLVAPGHADDQSLSRSQCHDTALVNAIVRAHRLQQMLDENNKIQCIEDVATKEKMTSSFITRLLRLNSLAPDIKKAILDGTHPKTFKLADLMKPFSPIWHDQRKIFGFPEIV